jgi:hypothetical protein
MLLSGFTFIRNAVKYDFPITECVESMLPLVDELVINVGDSDDATEELIARLDSPKIRLLHSKWDDSKTDRGLVLSEQTNLALDAVKGDWALYLQADEALHEAEHDLIRRQVAECESGIDGLRLRYLHFYGGYSLVQRPWDWYPSEIRVIRRASGARSFGDAQTFRGPEEKELQTKLIDAHVFHYGHARKPETMARKIHYFHRFWHGDEHGIKVNDANPYSLELRNLVWYWGTHPKPYAKRVAEGSGWSPTPESIAGATKIETVVIAASKSQKQLAEELASLLKRRDPSLAVQTVLGARQWFSASFSFPLMRRRRSALIDLWAEDRAWHQFVTWIFDAISLFGRRIAHAPRGRLSRFRARFYTAVSWGCHEEADRGFHVPEDAQLAQLERWLGFSP